MTVVNHFTEKNLYSVNQETGDPTPAHNFAKCLQIFKILSQAYSAVSIQRSDHERSRTSQTRRYITLWNVNVRKLAIIWKNCLFVEKIKLNLNVLNDLCHSKYSKCPTVARMQTRRRLRRWSMTSSITRCSTQAHTSVRRCIKSFISCTFSGGLVAELCPKFCSQLDWCQGCSAATNLEP